MKAKRSFRPTLQRVEDRVVLSFSLNSLFHSIVPGFPQHHAKHTTVHAATVTPQHPAHAHVPAHHAHAPAHHAHAIHALRHPAKA